jgi:hypothetical protein
MAVQSFKSLRDFVFFYLQYRPSRVDWTHPIGPIYPGLRYVKVNDNDMGWRLFGVTADGRLWDISGERSSEGHLHCGVCGGQILMDQQFQHDLNQDCFILSQSSIGEARLAFMRWAIIRVMVIDRNREDDYYKEKLDDLLLSLYEVEYGENEDFSGLLAWANSEFWNPADGRYDFITFAGFQAGEAIVHRLNRLLFPAHRFRKMGLFVTPFPPGSNGSEEARTIQSLMAHFARNGNYQLNVVLYSIQLRYTCNIFRIVFITEDESSEEEPER